MGVFNLQIREGKVKVLTPREAGYAIQLSNRTLLDVRPSTERQKVNTVAGKFLYFLNFMSSTITLLVRPRSYFGAQAGVSLGFSSLNHIPLSSPFVSIQAMIII